MEKYPQKKPSGKPSKTQIRRTQGNFNVQRNLGLLADDGNEVLGVLSMSCQDQQSNLLHSAGRLSSGSTGKHLILKQRNLNNEEEWPATHSHYMMKSSRPGKATHQDLVHSMKPIRFSRDNSDLSCKGYASACSNTYSSVTKDDLHYAFKPEKQKDMSLQHLVTESAFRANKMLVQSNVQICKAHEKPSVLTSDVIFNPECSELSSQEEPCFNRGTENPCNLNDYSPACQKLASEHFSTFQNVLDSSWTSASMKMSMLDLRKSEDLLASESAERQPPSSCTAFSSSSDSGDGTENKGLHNTPKNISCYFVQRGRSCFTCKLASKSGKTISINKKVHESHHFYPENIKMSSHFCGDDSAELSSCPHATIAESLPVAVESSKSQKGGTKVLCSGLRRELTSAENFGLKEVRYPSSVCQGFSHFKSTGKELVSLDPIQLQSTFDTADSSSFINVEMEKYSFWAHSITDNTEVSKCDSLMDSLHLIKESYNLIQEVTGESDTKVVGIKRNHQQLGCLQGIGNCDFTTENSHTKHKRIKCRVNVADMCSTEEEQPPSFPQFLPVHGFKESICSSRGGTKHYKRSVGVAEIKPLSASHRSKLSKQPSDPVKIYSCGPVVAAKGRGFLSLYRHQLLAKCFETWVQRVRQNATARLEHKKQLLHWQGLAGAVQVPHLQYDNVSKRKRAGMLSQCFNHWKEAFARRHIFLKKTTPDIDLNVEALRRRLVRPSNELILRSAYCPRRRNITCLHIPRAAEIHYNLTLLCKHWAIWRQLKIKKNARRQQEQAFFCMEHTLKKKVFMAWSTAVYKTWLAKKCFRDHTVSAVFKAWSMQVQYIKCERQQKGFLTSQFQRSCLLKQSFHHWRSRLGVYQSEQEKIQEIVRMAAQRWRQAAHKKKLEGLCSRATQVLYRRRQAIAFRTWHELKASVDLERSSVMIVRHLLDERKLKAAFASWHRFSLQRRGAQLFCEKAQKRQLLCCLEAWRKLVHQKSISVYYWAKLQRHTVKLCFQRWKQDVALFCLQKTFVIHLVEERQRQAKDKWKGFQMKQVNAFSAMMDRHHRADELCAALVLQGAFQKWKEEQYKLQMARVFSEAVEKRRLRDVVKHLHRVAEHAVNDGVRRLSSAVELREFQAPGPLPEDSPPASFPLHTACSSFQQVILDIVGRKGHRGLHISLMSVEHMKSEKTELNDWSKGAHEQELPLQTSSSPCRLKPGMTTTDNLDQTVDICTLPHWEHSTVMLKGPKRLKALVRFAVNRIMHQSVSMAFLQWRLYVSMRREINILTGYFKGYRSQSVKSSVFDTWKCETVKQINAKNCWETGLLSRSLDLWKRLVFQQRRKCLLQKKAVQFHKSHLLTLSFTSWQRKRKLKVINGDAEDLVQQERKALWFQKTVERQRVHQSFTLWAAHVRQSCRVLVYYRHALLTRVFVAWESWVQRDRERRALAAQTSRLRCCRLHFARWRVCLAQHLEAEKRIADRCVQHIRQTLLHWHSLTHHKCQIRNLLSAFLHNMQRTLKKRALLIWAQRSENLQNAKICYQRSVKKRCLQQWRMAVVHEEHLRVLKIWHEVTQTNLTRSKTSFLAQWHAQFREVQQRQRSLEWSLTKEENSLKAAVIHHWKLATRVQQAHRLHNRIVLLQYYSRWRWQVAKKCRDRIILNTTLTEDWYHMRLCEKYWKRWHSGALLQKFHRRLQRRRTALLWDQWKSETAAILFTRSMYEQSLLGKAWKMWRKRRIQTRVSVAFLVQQNRALLTEVFTAWHKRSFAQKMLH
ncbi:uncharacterized protein [Lepisosteus oculatus]|uniref:uncharacterized protein isoform X1 n=1 Tax=Lepisosteus oculatus TaxID=7918 RepID=UPI00371B684B